MANDYSVNVKQAQYNSCIDALNLSSTPTPTLLLSPPKATTTTTITKINETCALAELAAVNIAAGNRSYQASISLETTSSLDESLAADSITADVADQQQFKQQEQLQNSLNLFERNQNSPNHDSSMPGDTDSLVDDQLESMVNTISTTTEMEADSITEYVHPAHPAATQLTPVTTMSVTKPVGHKRTQSSVSCRSTASQRAAAAALQMLPVVGKGRLNWVSKSFKVF